MKILTYYYCYCKPPLTLASLFLLLSIQIQQVRAISQKIIVLFERRLPCCPAAPWPSSALEFGIKTRNNIFLGNILSLDNDALLG